MRDDMEGERARRERARGGRIQTDGFDRIACNDVETASGKNVCLAGDGVRRKRLRAVNVANVSCRGASRISICVNARPEGSSDSSGLVLQASGNWSSSLTL